MMGATRCPVCKGKGHMIEDSDEYMFETRDPLTTLRLTCGGRGWVGIKKKLPNGELVKSLVKEIRRVKAREVEKPEDFEPQRTQNTQRKDAISPGEAKQPEPEEFPVEEPIEATRYEAISALIPRILATIVIPSVAEIHVFDTGINGATAQAGYLIKQIIKAIKGE